MPSVYLKNMPLKKAQNILFDKCKLKISSETIPTEKCLGRITKEPVFSLVSSPAYNASAMDGIAVDAKQTETATDTTPLTLQTPDFVYVNTGQPIEEPYNAVIKMEDLVERDDNEVTIMASASAYQHIRPIGEDIVEKTMIIPKHHKLRPVDISAMLAAGVETVEVIKKPKVVFVPTGDEIVRDVKKLKKGMILDSNSYFVENALSELGVDITIHDVVKDDFELLETTVKKLSKAYDLVLIGAGSSAGSKDFVKDIISKHGEVYIHGVAIKPGKPTLIGKLNETTVIGLPGYPVSTYIAFTLFIKPLILQALKQKIYSEPLIKATLSKNLYTSLDSQEYVRVGLSKTRDAFIATPLPRGAGMMMSVVQADGLLIVPKDQEGYKANEQADVILLKPLHEIENKLSITGSHDILIDEMDTFMRDQGRPIASNHVGSYGGIMAIKAKECHLAPVHLLDEEGNYNDYLLTKYLDSNYALIRGVGRIQGFYTKANNPKQIKTISDLSKENVRFINRQRGSGTRLFLDYLLKEKSIDPKTITGYQNEVPTHTMVASAVKNGDFDTGLGIESVANLYGLDFIPIGVERYDFLVHKDSLKDEIVQAFITILKSSPFQARLKALGGYTFENSGEIVK